MWPSPASVPSQPIPLKVWVSTLIFLRIHILFRDYARRYRNTIRNERLSGRCLCRWQGQLWSLYGHGIREICTNVYYNETEIRHSRTFIEFWIPISTGMTDATAWGWITSNLIEALYLSFRMKWNADPGTQWSFSAIQEPSSNNGFPFPREWRA